jgi:leucyl-tRNA synthetase
VALVQFAEVETELLVEQKGIAIVQIDGKLRDKFEVDVSISEDELRELALSSEQVKRTLQGKEISNIIVRAPKLVNIATK